MTEQVDDIVCRPIGVIHSPYMQVTGIPIQTADAPQTRGSFEVQAKFLPGLKNLADFEYLILLTHLHLCSQEQVEVVPFLVDHVRGVFAICAIRPLTSIA